MAQRTIWKCDRCKADNIDGVFHVDLGNDYSTPREAGIPNKKRIAKDLCKFCHNQLMEWLAGVGATIRTQRTMS